MNGFDINQDSSPRSERIEIPKVQVIILAIILAGYPLLSIIMNYVNPPDKVVIESRIIQVYLPALLFQAIIFSSLMIAVLKAPLRQDGALWTTKQNLASIGIRRDDLNWKNAAIAVVFLFAAILILNVLSTIIGYYGLFQAEDITYLLPRTSVEKSIWIVLSVSAGVTEELAFRGFVLTRMEILTGYVWPGVMLGAFSFGIGHLYQGWAGVVLIGIYGIMFSLLFIGRGSLIPCVIAHALQDILAAFAM
jgi:membrane protease YdiL (CAAX protease family)